MGMKKLKVRSGLSMAEVKRRLRSALSDRHRQRLRALILMMSGRHSAGEIAARVGISRPQLFNWKRRLNDPDGLDGLLAIGHGGGRPPALKGQILSDFKVRLARGETVAELQYWLNRRGIRIKTSGVSYWARKLGFPKTKARVRSAVLRPLSKPKRASLRVQMDQATRDRTVRVVEMLTYIPSFKMLEALVLLVDRTTAQARRVDLPKQLSIEAITAECECSRTSLYRWAEKWRRSGSDWNLFVSTECSPSSRQEIKKFLSNGNHLKGTSEL